MKTNMFKDKSCFNQVKKTNLYELYHRNSELNSISLYKFGEDIQKAMNDGEFLKTISEEKILYDNCLTIELPEPNSKSMNTKLFDVLYNRRSVRKFNNCKKINIEELSTILFYSGGVTGEYEQFENKPKINF